MFLVVSSPFSEKLLVASIGALPGAVLFPIGATIYRLWGRRGCLPGMILAVLFLGAFLAISVRAPWYTWRTLRIEASEIPIYPRAQNLVFDDPSDTTQGTGGLSRLIGTWTFTTRDSPETAWGFYVDELSQRWGFIEWPILPEAPRRLVVRSCPGYEFIMTPMPIDATTNRITIQLTSSPCF
jgi:hypothetical protein